MTLYEIRGPELYYDFTMSNIVYLSEYVFIIMTL